MALTDSEKRKREDQLKKPKLTILSRIGSRSITNEDLLVKLAKEIGLIELLNWPGFTGHLSDVMIGVHGAAMTYFLFLKPGCVFTQVIPLGTEWAAETYYGGPAMKLGLKYIRYKILPRESSLYNEYDKDDPVLRDPKSVVKRGWQFTKKIYLDNQTMKLDLKRFRKHLVRAYGHSMSRRSSQAELQL
ncbi:Xylan glycosyltransferase muci21 [Ancistrocladus abbreviatus]